MCETRIDNCEREILAESCEDRIERASVDKDPVLHGDRFDCTLCLSPSASVVTAATRETPRAGTRMSAERAQGREDEYWAMDEEGGGGGDGERMNEDEGNARAEAT